VLIELLSLSVMAEALRANIDKKSTFSLKQGQFGPKFQVEVAPSKKTRINDLSCGIRMWAQVSFVLSQSARLIDGRTERPWQHRTIKM